MFKKFTIEIQRYHNMRNNLLEMGLKSFFQQNGKHSIIWWHRMLRYRGNMSYEHSNFPKSPLIVNIFRIPSEYFPSIFLEIYSAI